MASDRNANIAEPEATLQGEATADDLAMAGLVDMVRHSLPRHKPLLQDSFICSMRRDGREVRSRMDYILGTYIILFQDVAVWDPQHNSDHYMVLGYLHHWESIVIPEEGNQPHSQCPQ